MTSVRGVNPCLTSSNFAVNSMVQIRRWKKRLDIDAKLKKYRDIFAIESEVQENAVYCISDGKFAVLCWDGVVYCPIGEYKELANRMKEEIKQEILDVMEMWGGKHESMQEM